MSPARRTVEEYSALLARAFNGAVTVNGQRIVAHPSGMLFARTNERVDSRAARASTPDRDNDWSDV